MNRKMLAATLVLGTLGAVFGAACGDKNPVDPTAMMIPVPKANMYIRGSFDTDPSMYVGRFIPSNSDPKNLDESGAMKLTCSQHISYSKIGAGGVTYDEVYQASSSAAASLNIPTVGAITGGASSGTTVRVKYTLLNKMVADVKDPAAFESCCKAAPDQCTNLYVGEFLEGTGELFYATASGQSAKGGVNVPQAGVEFEMKNGVAWAKSMTFSNPVYFAFKTVNNMYTGAVTSGCGDWVNAPPRSTQGQYFVGISDPMGSEKQARDQALRSGRTQVVQWMGESITAGSQDISLTTGQVTGLQTQLQNQSVVESATSGVASLVKDENWCITQTDTPNGPQFVAKTLMMLPKEQQKAAAEAVIKATGAK